MCQPVKDYLGVLREYKAEVMTFVGLILMAIIYVDYRDLARETAANNAETNAALQQITTHLSELKNWHVRIDSLESRREKP